MMAAASRIVCIEPRDTRRVVERDAGWLALRDKVAAVVITTERTAAQSRGEVTKPVDTTFGAFQAASTQRENNPAPSPAICPAIMLYVRALGASGFSTSSYAVGPRLAKISGLRQPTRLRP